MHSRRGEHRPADGVPAQLRIGYQSIPNGDLIVKHYGWLEEALPDTEIIWSRFDSGGDVNTAFLAGELDIALAGSAPVTRGLSQPLDIDYQVAWIHDVIDDNEALVAVEGITEVADLAGTTVAVPFASTTHYHLIAALDEAGLTVDDVTLLDLEPPDILAAWQRGDIDAAFVWYPVLGQLRAAGGTTLITSGELADRGKVTADLGVVSTDFATAYPEALATWVEQQNRAVALIQEDKAAASKPSPPNSTWTPRKPKSRSTSSSSSTPQNKPPPITSAPPTTPAGWPNTSG